MINLVEPIIKYCHCCNTLLIDRSGNMIRDYLHLVRNGTYVYICSECCEIGVHKPFEKLGFKPSELK